MSDYNVGKALNSMKPKTQVVLPMSTAKSLIRSAERKFGITYSLQEKRELLTILTT